MLVSDGDGDGSDRIGDEDDRGEGVTCAFCKTTHEFFVDTSIAKLTSRATQNFFLCRALICM